MVGSLTHSFTLSSARPALNLVHFSFLAEFDLCVNPYPAAAVALRIVRWKVDTSTVFTTSTIVRYFRCINNPDTLNGLPLSLFHSISHSTFTPEDTLAMR